MGWGFRRHEGFRARCEVFVRLKVQGLKFKASRFRASGTTRRVSIVRHQGIKVSARGLKGILWVPTMNQ